MISVRAVSESFHLAKDAGYKVVARKLLFHHIFFFLQDLILFFIDMMPDLPNVGVERDLEQFKVSVSNTYKKKQQLNF